MNKKNNNESTGSCTRSKTSNMEVELLTTLPNRPRKPPLDTHFLEGMNLSRHHVFSTFNKHGDLAWADNVIDNHLKANDIEVNQDLGLTAELQFYHAFKDKLDLVPALDCGDNTDFVGNLKGHLVRFDVTTSIDSKRKNWERFLRHKYHFIVVWDKETKAWSFFVANKDHKGEFRKVK